MNDKIKVNKLPSVIIEDALVSVNNLMGNNLIPYQLETTCDGIVFDTDNKMFYTDLFGAYLYDKCGNLLWVLKQGIEDVRYNNKHILLNFQKFDFYEVLHEVVIDENIEAELIEKIYKLPFVTDTLFHYFLVQGLGVSLGKFDIEVRGLNNLQTRSKYKIFKDVLGIYKKWETENLQLINSN